VRRWWQKRWGVWFGLVLVATTAAVPGRSQTLDAVVARQLAFDLGGSLPCSELLDQSPTIPVGQVFTGHLVDLCTRATGLPGGGPSISTGGGAAAPATLPGIVQQRLREQRNQTKGPKTGGASADAAVDGRQQSGLFVLASSETLDRSVTAFEDGYGSRIQRLTVGGDVQIARQWTAGIAADYYRQRGDFTGGGSFRTDSYGILGFANFIPDEPVFAQVYAGWSRKKFDRTRLATLTDTDSSSGQTVPVISGLLEGDYVGNEYRLGALAGYDFQISNLSIGPFVQLDWARLKLGNYTEQGRTLQSFNNFIPAGEQTGMELTFYDDAQTSLQSRLGMQAFVTSRIASWVVVPQVSVGWIHEFKNDQRNIWMSFAGDTRARRFAYQTDAPDRDWGEVAAAVAVVLPNGMQPFGMYRIMVGNGMFRSQAVTIGLRVPL
jgi:outer membrane autotransporter protein